MLTILLLCFVGQIFGANVHQTTAPQPQPGRVVQQALNSAGGFVSSYKQISLEDLQKLAKEHGRYQDTYSSSIAPLLGQFVGSMLTTADRSADAMMPVYEWCGTATTLLEIFVGMPEQSILPNVIEEEESTISNTLAAMGRVSESLKGSKNLLAAISNQLSDDFSENSEFFQAKLNAVVLREMNRRISNRTITTQRAMASRNSQQDRNTNQMTPEEMAALENEVKEEMQLKLKAQFAETQQFYANLDRQIDEKINEVSQVKDNLQQQININKSLQINKMDFDTAFDRTTRNNLKKSSIALIRKCNEYRKGM